jgi:hypothetical protein
MARTDGLRRGMPRTDGLLLSMARTDGLRRGMPRTDGLLLGMARTDGLRRGMPRTDGLLLSVARTDGFRRAPVEPSVSARHARPEDLPRHPSHRAFQLGTPSARLAPHRRSAARPEQH